MWAISHPVRLLFLVALGLRAGVALVTEVHPLLPDYHYTDAHYMDEIAGDMLKARAEGRYFMPGFSPSKRVHAMATEAVYRVAGRRPIAMKLLQAFIGSLAVVAFFYLAAGAVGPGAALVAAAAVAVWPTNVFMTSQNFKDGPVALCVFTAMALLARAMSLERGRDLSRALLLAWMALLAVGFLRPYMLAVLAGVGVPVCAGAGVFRRRQGRPAAAMFLGALTILAAPIIYKPFAAYLFNGPLAPSITGLEDPTVKSSIIPMTYDATAAKYIAPFSPQRLTEMRRIRQVSDQAWAQIYKGRRIGTQLFYGLEFKTWWDVAVFLPKGMFYALFMPLPGLYPLEGNTGRLIASLENVPILLLSCLGLAGALRGGLTAERAWLLGVFAAMAAGSGLLEFDLGSATRHRILYVPLLFPFAGLLATRRALREGRRRVVQVLECGGPGGTGRHVAAICNGLDPARFETALIFSSRGADPGAYRDSAPGAERAYHVPEMTREISPIRDFTAFLKLARLLRREQPDIVHAHSSKAGFLARGAAWLTGVPLVYYSPRGYGFLQQDRSALSRGLYRALEASVSWIGEIVAVSPSESELARALAWGRPVHVVCDPYLGDTDPPAPRPERAATVVGACGRLTFARNPEAFLNLAQRLTDSRNGLRCLWIGAGELESDFRRQLENMNLTSKVTVTGWLEPEEAARRLAELDVFVHYSRWEGLPGAVLDAMAAGLPVVASDTAGNRDAVLDGETGFIAKSEIELLERALQLVDDPALRARLGAAGRRRVLETFSRGRAREALDGLYSRPASGAAT